MERRCISRLALVASVLTLTAQPVAASAEADTDGGSGPTVTVGQPWTIYENLSPPGEPQYAGFPAIFDAGEVDATGQWTHDYYISYNAGIDVIGKGVVEQLRSADGASFAEYAGDPRLDIHTAVRFTNPARDLISVGYEPIFDNPSPPYENVDNEREFPLFGFVGGQWVRQSINATVTTDVPIAIARFTQGIVTLPNGDLVAPLYGSTADGRSYVYVVASSDGINWHQTGTVATGPSGRWTEGNLLRLPDSTMAAVVRYQNPQTGRLDLYLVRSTTADGSGQWSEPVELAAQAGAMPRLQQLANGTLAIVSGRLDNQLRVSFDGLGQSWTSGQTLYANYPVGVPDSDPKRTLGSSGYVGVVPTSPDDLLIVGDNCAGQWGCPASVPEFTHGTQKTLWAAEANLDPGLGDRLDLLGMFREGKVHFVQTEPVAYAKGQPSLLPYAFDGDTSSVSSLVTADRAATLDLGRPYRLDALVVHASLVGPTALSVQTSVDGVHWKEVEATVQGATYRLNQPTPARYLRLTDPNPTSATTANWSFLDELQLYV